MVKRQLHRGVVLIEALVALLIVALGMVAMMGLQTSLRRTSDLARQRGDALRMAQQDMETLRAFSALNPGDAGSPDNARYFSSIQGLDGSQVVTDPKLNGGNTIYTLKRTIQTDPDLPLASVHLVVNWTDRMGGADELQQVTLDSTIAGIDPSLSGALTLAPSPSALSRAAGGNAPLPAGAKDIGGGRSVYKPLANGTVAWVFNSVTGVITSICSVPSNSTSGSLVSADLLDCQENLTGYLLSGVVRFSWTLPPDSENPSGPAITVGILPILTSKNHLLTPGFNCHTDSPSARDPGQIHVRYSCVVFPNSDAKPVWSGYVDLSGLAFTGKDAVRVCRYSADYDGDKVISNAEHPLQYLGVNGALRNQNFLVIKASENCPAGHGIDPSKGQFRNTATVLHQDSTTPSHTGS